MRIRYMYPNTIAISKFLCLNLMNYQISLRCFIDARSSATVTVSPVFRLQLKLFSLGPRLVEELGKGSYFL